MNMKIVSIENRDLKRGQYQKRMVVEVNGQVADVYFTSRPYNKTYRERKRKSRLSVYGTAVESIAEDFVNRTRRPYKVYREAAKPFLEALGLPTKGIVWNQYAFCSCPCSPAFVMPEHVHRKIGYGYHGVSLTDLVDIDIHIREALPMVDESVEMDMNRAQAITGVLAGVC